MRIRMLVALIVTLASLALAPAAPAEWPDNEDVDGTSTFEIRVDGRDYVCKFGEQEPGVVIYVCVALDDPHSAWVCERKPDGPTFKCAPWPPNTDLAGGDTLAEGLRLADTLGDIPPPPENPEPLSQVNPLPGEEYIFVTPPYSDDPCVLNGAVTVSKEPLPRILYVTWGDGTSSLYDIPAGIGHHYVTLTHPYYLEGLYEVWVAKLHSGHGEAFLFDHNQNGTPPPVRPPRPFDPPPSDTTS